MIQAIRNQPFQFGNNLQPRSLALMCCADDPVPSLIAVADEVWAQAMLTQCGGEGGIVISGGPEGWDDWVAGDGFFLSGTSYVLAAPTPGTSMYILENAVAGSQYTIQLDVTNVTGTAYAIFGGVQSSNLVDGLNDFLITANSASPFELIVDSGTITVNSVVVTALNTDVSAIFHQGGTDLVFDRDDYPDNFYFFNGGFTFHMPMSTVGITEGCFSLELRDNCTDTGMTSQVFKIVDVNCETFLIRACNDYDNIGFVVPFAPRIRIPASMGWPSYNTDVQEERHSDGEIFRPYGDRTRTMTVKTGILNEFDHAFLSTLPIWDHVYIGAGVQAQEVVVSKGKYEPLYGEDQNLNGSVVFDVTPKAELVRKVQCGPALDGCAPESDPQCIGGPQYAWTFIPVDGGFDFQLIIFATSNFTPGTASITVADGSPVTQTVGTLPSTLTWGPFAEEAPLTLRIFDTMNQNCVITKFFDVPEEPEPFVCEGEEYGSFSVPSGGAVYVEYIVTSTGHYTARDQDGNTVLDQTEFTEGTYCIYPSDTAKVKSGTMDQFAVNGDVRDLHTEDYSSATGFQFLVLTGTPSMPSVDTNTGLIYYVILDADTISAAPSMALCPDLDNYQLSYSPLVTTLPDFHPSALVEISIFDASALANIGVLPRIKRLSISGSAITSPSVVDALINALEPSSAGTCDIGSLLTLRTSASDTNYNACISAGWTIT